MTRRYISYSTGSKSVGDPFPVAAAVFPHDGTHTQLYNVHAIPSAVMAEKVTPESPAHASPLSVRFMPQNSQQGRRVLDSRNDCIVSMELPKSELGLVGLDCERLRIVRLFSLYKLLRYMINLEIVYLESGVSDNVWLGKRILCDDLCKGTMPTIT